MTSATSARGPFPIVDLHDITTGQATYGIDAKIPGMKFAVIARPPVVGGKLVSFDATEALKVPGVEKVVEVQGWPWPSKFMPVGGVAVVARNTGCAIKGRDKLKVVWDNGPNATYDSAAFRKQMEQTAASPCKVVRNDGDAEGALKSAAKVVTAQYYLPHLAHASMEPPNAVVHVSQGKAGTECVAYAPTQSPGGCRDDLAKMLGIPVENVTVNVTLLGGGFGRKSKWDYVLEAALVSKATGRADQGRLDARGRHPARLLPHRVGRTDRRRDRCQRQGGRMAAPQRGADDRLHLQGRRGPRGAVRTRHGAGGQSVQHPQPALRERRSARRIPASAGSARSPTSRTASRCSRWSRRSRRRSGAIRRTCCWNCSGRIASSIRASRPRSPTTGTTAIRSRPIRSTPDGCAVSRSLPRNRPGGASRCRRARASASPCIAAS